MIQAYILFFIFYHPLRHLIDYAAHKGVEQYYVDGGED